ncbi:M20/M25/M40 family metallo-hydrolase [Desertivirga arenae]|uniref:M20/M25/M40 family metallo-hydrolase n=1 Tax=Desertivirga arenae TaxID=2810309 RepID=UPI001F61A6DE|nr:M20/M25/M40 family metallo-hydrolase [Pedobacter sp. SYSU D00823]
MMKRFLSVVGFAAVLSACSVQKPTQLVKDKDVERIIKTLSADDMQGRGIFTPGIDRAASFIEAEFKAIGLKPLNGLSGFRQDFSMNRIAPASYQISINGKAVEKENVFYISDKPSLSWSKPTEVEIQYIKANESFTSRYKAIMQLNKPVLVYVDEALFSAFKRFRDHYMEERVVGEFSPVDAVFVLGNENSVESFSINLTNTISKAPLFNVAGMLPGRSKANEYVIFSGHYDHLGVIEAVEGDSIANGADDDASGITAVISLAKYYKQLNNNERTLIFAAFTAEEVGGIGSQYFSRQQNPDSVMAMFNIEMIGKDSKFGKNSAFITGYEKSDFGQILQKNLQGTEFKFHPDPYPEQNLFYRSDNATLAAQGVPAHTISTDQIDQDKFYHTVNDELSTLDIANIVSTIKAIALSSRSIVAGTDTPRRIEKLKE